MLKNIIDDEEITAQKKFQSIGEWQRWYIKGEQEWEAGFVFIQRSKSLWKKVFSSYVEGQWTQIGHRKSLPDILMSFITTFS